MASIVPLPLTKLHWFGVMMVMSHNRKSMIRSKIFIMWQIVYTVSHIAFCFPYWDRDTGGPGCQGYALRDDVVEQVGEGGDATVSKKILCFCGDVVGMLVAVLGFCNCHCFVYCRLQAPIPLVVVHIRGLLPLSPCLFLQFDGLLHFWAPPPNLLVNEVPPWIGLCGCNVSDLTSNVVPGGSHGWLGSTVISITPIA